MKSDLIKYLASQRAKFPKRPKQLALHKAPIRPTKG